MKEIKKKAAMKAMKVMKKTAAMKAMQVTARWEARLAGRQAARLWLQQLEDSEPDFYSLLKEMKATTATMEMNKKAAIKAPGEMNKKAAMKAPGEVMKKKAAMKAKKVTKAMKVMKKKAAMKAMKVIKKKAAMKAMKAMKVSSYQAFKKRKIEEAKKEAAKQAAKDVMAHRLAVKNILVPYIKNLEATNQTSLLHPSYESYKEGMKKAVKAMKVMKKKAAMKAMKAMKVKEKIWVQWRRPNKATIKAMGKKAIKKEHTWMDYVDMLAGVMPWPKQPMKNKAAMKAMKVMETKSAMKAMKVMKKKAAMKAMKVMKKKRAMKAPKMTLEEKAMWAWVEEQCAAMGEKYMSLNDFDQKLVEQVLVEEWDDTMANEKGWEWE